MTNIPDDAIKCLDKGFVRLVDSMGGDNAIVQAARVSYGKVQAKLSQDRGLIRYLMYTGTQPLLKWLSLNFIVKCPFLSHVNGLDIEPQI